MENVSDMVYYDNWLINNEYISLKKMKRLLEFFENSKQIYKAGDKELIDTGVFSDEQFQEFKKLKSSFDPEKEYKRLVEKDIKFIPLGSEDYPKNLANIDDPPLGLYLKGKLPDKNRPSVAIIGSRNNSSYGERMAKLFASELSKMGIQIISGMAYGIDSIAQKTAAYSGGYSLAVLGSSVEFCYPFENYNLYNQLIKTGGVISEYPIDTKPVPWHFPMRNRIISGLSDLVLVVEARKKSGTLITVDRALDQGKDVYAVPGRVEDSLSEGCNNLIRQGAGIAASVEDVIRYFKPEFEKNNSEKPHKVFDKETEMIYKNIKLKDCSINELINETGININKIIKICTELELKGYIKKLGVGNFTVT